MDVDIFRGLITLSLIILFLGICVWAWSSKRKQDFIEAANLPLLDDHDHLTVSEQHSNEEKHQ